MKRTQRTSLVLWVGLALLVSPACKRGSEQAGNPSGGPEPPWNESVTMEQVHPVNIELGRGLRKDNHVAEPALVFRPNDSFDFAVVTEGTAAGPKIAAVVTYQTGAPVFETSRVVNLEGPAVTAFRASNVDGWRVGKYQLRILVNGESFGTKDFEVQ